MGFVSIQDHTVTGSPADLGWKDPKDVPFPTPGCKVWVHNMDFEDERESVGLLLISNPSISFLQSFSTCDLYSGPVYTVF